MLIHSFVCRLARKSGNIVNGTATSPAGSTRTSALVSANSLQFSIHGSVWSLVRSVWDVTTKDCNKKQSGLHCSACAKEALLMELQSCEWYEVSLLCEKTTRGKQFPHWSNAKLHLTYPVPEDLARWSWCLSSGRWQPLSSQNPSGALHGYRKIQWACESPRPPHSPWPEGSEYLNSYR